MRRRIGLTLKDFGTESWHDAAIADKGETTMMTTGRRTAPTTIGLGNLVGVIGLAAAILLIAPHPATAADQPAANEIRIDVPVALTQAKVVFNMDHSAAMVGDQPIGLTYMARMLVAFATNHTDWRMVAVFHNTPAYLLLDDAAYNKARNTTHGNPYKDQILALIRQGVEIDECAVTMKANGWGNADLVPGVKVTTAAVGRIVQLVQDGYVQIEP